MQSQGLLTCCDEDAAGYNHSDGHYNKSYGGRSHCDIKYFLELINNLLSPNGGSQTLHLAFIRISSISVLTIRSFYAGCMNPVI